MRVIETDRLLLRQWRPEDREPFARMSADPEVMEHFPALLSASEADAVATRLATEIEEFGYGFWALESRATGDFVGFTGIRTPRDVLPFSPCIEIGWRLVREHWGRGYASEAARAALDFGFRELGLPEIVSFTALGNVRSRRVMERLRMTERGEFDHPALAPDSPLRRHVWFSVARVRE